MLIDPNYRRHRIEVDAVAVGDRWDAEVRIRHHAVNAKPHVETVTCCKLKAAHSELAGELWARRWIRFAG